MTAKNKRRIVVLVFVAILFLLSFGGYSIYRFNTSVSPSDLALRQKLVGTWIRDATTIVLRPDGTGEYSENDLNTVRSSELSWTTSGNKLQVHNGAPERKLKVMILRYVFSDPGMESEVFEISDKHMEILDFTDRERATFNKATESP